MPTLNKGSHEIRRAVPLPALWSVICIKQTGNIIQRESTVQNTTATRHVGFVPRSKQFVLTTKFILCLQQYIIQKEKSTGHYQC